MTNQNNFVKRVHGSFLNILSGSRAINRKFFSLTFIAGCSISGVLAQTNAGFNKAKTVAVRKARLDQWYNADSRGGLFVHWGMGTGTLPGKLKYPNVKAFDNATAAAKWSPEFMVNAAVKLNCKYIIWATMHVEHGLLRTWKSKIPGTPVTRRDYLGELCKAAALKGIKVVVYLTGDAALKENNVKAFIDAPAYAKYKNLNVDIRNNNKDWIKYYLKDVMFEVMDNYPDVVGFWCDGWDMPAVDTLTLAAVHAKKPNYLIFRNEYSNQPSYDDVDVMGVEPFAKILAPEYDKASGMYVSPGNGIEASFVISSDWWYTGSAYGADFKWCVKMAASALGGNAIPCYAEGTAISGRFVANVNKVNDSMKHFFDYSFESINNVWGGGALHGGLKSGTMEDGAYVATTLSKDGNTHYIHVLNKPTTNPNELVIPMLGYKITGVKSLDSKNSLPYSVRDNSLFITVNSWAKFDSFGDEIIQITTAGTPHILSHTGWNVRASNVDRKYPAANILDTSYDTYYSSLDNAGMPVDLIIDMGTNTNIYAMNVSQYEGRALTTARYYPVNEGTRIRDYEIYASNDGLDWGKALVSGTMKNERGVKDIAIPQGTKDKRYIKLSCLNNYYGNGVVQITNIDFFTKPES
jgi:alpha-L-fucosidase